MWASSTKLDISFSFSIGVRIPGGQPKLIKTELPRTYPNILAREDVLILQHLTWKLGARTCEGVRLQPAFSVGVIVGYDE